MRQQLMLSEGTSPWKWSMAQKTKKTAGTRKTSTGAKAAGSTRKKSSGTGGSGQKGGSSARRTAGTRSTAGKNSSSAQRTEARNRARRQKEERQREIRMDIALVVMLLIMFFLYLSLLGFCGSVGDILERILFGLFGWSAWGLPLWLFCFCLYLLNGTGGKQMPVRLASCAILMLVVGAGCHLRLHAAHIFSLETSFDFQRTFSMCAERTDGGGILGGWFSWILYRAFGMVGSILCEIGLVIIALILLLQRSPAGMIRSWQERRQEEGIPGFSERRALNRQRRLEELEAREERRLERETDRILRREQSRPVRNTGASDHPQNRRRKKADPAVSMDLEHTLLGYEERPGAEAARRRASRARRTKDPYKEGMVQTGRRRDVHEIVLVPGKDEDTYDAYSGSPRSAASGRQDSGLFTISGRSGPEPGGTTYRSPSSMDRGLEDDFSGANSSAGAPAGPFTTFAEQEAAAGGISPALETIDMEQGPASAAIDGHLSGRTYFHMPEDVQGMNGIQEQADSSPEPRPTGAAGPAEQAGPAGNGTGGAPASTGSAAAAGFAPSPGSAAAAGFIPSAGSAAAANMQPAGLTAPSEEALEGISVHRDSGAPKKSGRAAGKTAAARRGGSYVHPPYDLLERGSGGRSEETERELKETAYRLQETLRTFGVQVTITDISQGPSVTRYELMPDQGVKVSRIVNLSDDIKLRLAATDIRIEAPIPGKSAIGIEVPNRHETTVHLRELLETRAFRRSERPLPFAVGRDIGGKPVIADITRMPHLLIAGATGSGKSVCINTIILSILYRTSPENVRLLMIDPKVVELSVYKGIPHLIIPVVTDARKASAALNWAVAEMEKRYKLFAAAGVRDLVGYNALARKYMKEAAEEGKPQHEPMPRLVIIVDELADLMMVAKSEVESAICRLAQLARAAGIHLIIATQRPSVDVITGLIKANMPSRIAFAVSSQVDSRTILDMAGAEKLIGRGDMLFKPQDYQKPARIQGAFVSDDEVTRVVDYIRSNNAIEAHDEEIDRQIDDIAVNGMPDPVSGEVKADPSRDEYFAEAGRFIIEKNKASIGLLQRVFKIGFNRAARIMDQLAEAGVVSEESSTRARQVLMSMPEFEAYLENET